MGARLCVKTHAAAHAASLEGLGMLVAGQGNYKGMALLLAVSACIAVGDADPWKKADASW